MSPQYHLVFDDEFSTIPFMRDGAVPPHWSELVKHSAELVTDEAFNIATTWANSYINDAKADKIDEEEYSTHLQLLLNENAGVTFANPIVTSSDTNHNRNAAEKATASKEVSRDFDLARQEPT